MYFDRWDICEAYYCYARDYMNGQNSAEMRIQSKLNQMRFIPSHAVKHLYTYESLSSNGRDIYDSLVRRYS